MYTVSRTCTCTCTCLPQWNIYMYSTTRHEFIIITESIDGSQYFYCTHACTIAIGTCTCTCIIICQTLTSSLTSCFLSVCLSWWCTLLSSRYRNDCDINSDTAYNDNPNKHVTNQQRNYITRRMYTVGPGIACMSCSVQIAWICFSWITQCNTHTLVYVIHLIKWYLTKFS